MQSRNDNRRQTLRRLGTGIIAMALAISAGTTLGRADDGKGNNNGNNNTDVRLRTNLAGGAINGQTPEGNADFRIQGTRMRLNVEVEHVNLPAGTVLQVVVTHNAVATTVGMITLNASGENELELNSQDGATVPAIVKGDMVTVMNGATAILTGVF